MRQLSITLSLMALLQLPAIAQTQVPETTSGNPSDSIQQVTAVKWMTNFSDGKFYPERLLSRSELASIMVKVFGLNNRQAVSKENLVIPDVPRSHWAFNDIQTVLKTDIMKGYRGNQFFPNQRVTRAEALAIFAQAYGVFQFPDEAVNEILASYPDEKSIPAWARKAIATVATEGFLNTDAQGNISPLRPVTRGDMAYVLSRYLQRQQQQPETPEVPIIPNSPQSP
ncbi:MAG: S-layer homology domain-containing protein [Nostoc indistinguendum CM1-VF10]|nr:S-layer homology domain-containing protein [Nostoc indistinguendum CM1-VF10]